MFICICKTQSKKMAAPSKRNVQPIIIRRTASIAVCIDMFDGYDVVVNNAKIDQPMYIPKPQLTFEPEIESKLQEVLTQK